MSEESVTSKNVSDLIDYLIKAKDPAVVGLRRILKKKIDTGQDFPLQEHILEELGTGGKKSHKIFTESEQSIMELENTILKLQQQKTELKKSSEKAIREAFQKGQQEGFLRGEKSAYDKARSEYDRQIRDIQEKLVTVFNNIEESRRELINETERNILDTAMVIAQKIINTEISLNPKIILGVIKKALSFIVDRHGLVVRVSPNDLESVTHKKDFWTSITERLDKVTVESDSRIEKGGCIIESNTGVADARITVQLKEIMEVIDATWENIMTSHTAGNEQEMAVKDSRIPGNPVDESVKDSEAEVDTSTPSEPEGRSAGEDAVADTRVDEDSIADDTPASQESDMQDEPGVPD